MQRFLVIAPCKPLPLRNLRAVGEHVWLPPEEAERLVKGNYVVPDPEMAPAPDAADSIPSAAPEAGTTKRKRKKK
jgi:hypothetical protein